MTTAHTAALADAITRVEQSPAFQYHSRWQEKAKLLDEVLTVIYSLADGSLRCADSKTEVVLKQEVFEGLQRDAERWRGLMSAPRIRLFGTAEYGKPWMHLGVEIWGSHPHGGGEGHQALVAFADARREDGYCSEPRWLSTPEPEAGK